VKTVKLLHRLYSTGFLASK